MDTDTSAVMAREKGGGGWVEVGKAGEMGMSVIVSTIKIKLKEKVKALLTEVTLVAERIQSYTLFLILTQGHAY